MKLLKSYILIGPFTFLILSCGKSPEGKMTDQEPGKMLAQKNCSSCHAFVEPNRLPKSAWKEILPIMGYFIGKGEEGFVLEDENVPGVREGLKNSFIFSQKSSITDEEWAAIQEYYENNSPEKLEKHEQPLSAGISQFSYEPHPWKGPSLGLTFLNYEGGVFKVGSSTKEGNALLAITKQGREISSYEAHTPVVDVIPVVDVTQNAQMDMVLQMGNMENVDDPTGRMATRTDKIRTVIAPLQRPVDFAIEDFNNDGGAEILVAEFGKYLGGINIYHKKESLDQHNVFPFQVPPDSK
jgi:hypothetical protein